MEVEKNKTKSMQSFINHYIYILNRVYINKIEAQ